jgi:hypothetical protein
MSTQSKGNYVFNILKNGATAADIVDNSATTAQAQQRIADLDQKIVDITKPSQGIRPPGTSAPRAERTTPSEPRTKR